MTATPVTSVDTEIERVMAADGSPLETHTMTWRRRGQADDDDLAAPAVDLLMAHACGFCKDTLAPLGSELQARIPAAQKGKAVSFDFRGHGGSAPLLAQTWEMAEKEPAQVWRLGPEDVKAVCGSTAILGRRSEQQQQQQQQQQPLLVGVGHSMGGAALLRALFEYPRADVPFDALILFEPVVSLQQVEDYPSPTPRDTTMATFTLRRKRAFPSLAEARAKLGSKPPYSKWDARAFDGFLASGLRPTTMVLPTAPSASAGPGEEVGLACAPKLEATFYGTELPPFLDSGLRRGRLPKGRLPPTLIIIGADSGHMAGSPGVPRNASYGEELRRRLLGGQADGAVDLVTMPGLGHLGPMEQPGAVAEVAAAWVQNRLLGCSATVVPQEAPGASALARL